MKKNMVSALLTGLVVLGLLLVSCDNGTTGGDDNGGYVDEPLPAASGANAVSGKTWYCSAYSHLSKTEFAATADGAKSGTYTVSGVTKKVYGEGDKYQYTTRETGTYTWNESKKTVTLKPEQFAESDGSSDDDTEGYEFGALEGRAAYRSKMEGFINAQIEGMTQAQIDEQLSESGFSSIAEVINYNVNLVFGNTTYDYSFSTDNTALFLTDALPASKGVNELSGQTYYGLTWDWETEEYVKDEDEKYVFAASGNTYTHGGYNGTYAYASSGKLVWFSEDTDNDWEAWLPYYMEVTVPAKHHYFDDNAYRAAVTIEHFYGRLSLLHYNSTDKTIN